MCNHETFRAGTVKIFVMITIVEILKNTNRLAFTHQERIFAENLQSHKKTQSIINTTFGLSGCKKLIVYGTDFKTFLINITVRTYTYY